MHTCTISMLLPIEKNIKFYESFLLQYSLVVSSNFIIFELIDNSTEEQILNMFEKYHGQIDDYKNNNIFLTSMMLESNVPQTSELRGLLLDKFFLSMSVDKKTSKFILSSFINAKEFLLIYAIFEGVIKFELVRSGVLDEGKFLKEKDIITNINAMLADKTKSFIKHLSCRSPLGKIEDVECFWDFFTHFRHLYTHSGGYVTAKWLEQFKPKKDKIIKVIAKFNCQISAYSLMDVVNKLELANGKMFYINDSFLNIFRNLIIVIIESLYLVEKVKQ